MSAITEETVTKIARLARIRVKDEEKPALAKEITGILGWIEQLAEVNTDGVEPMTGAARVALKQRQDIVNDGNIQSDVLKNAPETAEGFFVVPKVVE